jgi:phage tail tube protein FII
LKLPNLEENYVEHVGGGAIAAVEFFTHINRLEATFTLAGWQPRVMGLLAQGNISREAQRYTAYGVIREQRTGTPMKAEAKMWGRLGAVNPGAFRKGDLMEHDFTIKGITHYELLVEELISPDGSQRQMTQLYYWDYFDNQLVVDGQPVFERENALLGLFNVVGR